MMSLMYTVLLFCQFGFAVGVLVLLFFITAPYGKFTRKGWGVLIPAPVAWAVMESPAIVIPLLFFLFFGGGSPVLMVFLIIWLVHYVRRAIVYPVLLGNRSKSMPISIALMSLVFQLMNTYITGYGILGKPGKYSIEWLYSPQFIIGLCIFIIGYVINTQSDVILHNLKFKGDGGYQIPRGGLFSFISNPHYFGEIIEWTGWAVLTWSIPGAAFALFTFANLAPRGQKNHEWYRNTFPDYPEKRKAIIPFIW